MDQETTIDKFRKISDQELFGLRLHKIKNIWAQKMPPCTVLQFKASLSHYLFSISVLSLGITISLDDDSTM